MASVGGNHGCMANKACINGDQVKFQTDMGEEELDLTIYK